MPPPPYSLWDKLADTRMDRRFLLGLFPESVRIDRCRRRVAAFEAAADSGLVPTVGPGSPGDLRARRRWFDSHLDPEKTPPSLDDPRSLDRHAGCLNFLDLGWFLPGDIGPLFILLIAGLALGLLALPLAWTPVWITRFLRRRRCRAAMSSRLCPDCGQDLTGCPPAIPKASLDNLDIGPRLCPECAAPWPLLPPQPRDYAARR